MSCTVSDQKTAEFFRNIKVTSLDSNLSSLPFSSSNARSLQGKNSTISRSIISSAHRQPNSKTRSTIFRWRRVKYCWRHVPFLSTILMREIPKKEADKFWFIIIQRIKILFLLLLSKIARIVHFNWHSKTRANRKQSESYQYLLENPSFHSQLQLDGNPVGMTDYDPLLLDNPELRSRSNQSVICLPSFVVRLFPIESSLHCSQVFLLTQSHQLSNEFSTRSFVVHTTILFIRQLP